MSAHKNFPLNTQRFLTLWKDNLTSNGKTGDWKKFIKTIRGDTQPNGIAHAHAAYFDGKNGIKAIAKYQAEYIQFHEDSGIDLPKNLDEAVMDYFYNEKVLDKCNAIRSKPAMKKARRPDGWKKRPCVGSGGVKKTINWDDIAKGWSGLMD